MNRFLLETKDVTIEVSSDHSDDRVKLRIDGEGIWLAPSVAEMLGSSLKAIVHAMQEAEDGKA